MNIFYLLLGIILLVAVIVDLLWTTLWVDGGAGPVSSRLTTWLWRAWRKLGGSRSRSLSLAGPIILVATLSMWILLIAAGWTFVFAGAQDALIDTRDHEPVTWPARIWYVAYTMFTVGNGDFSPRDGLWQVVSSITAASGMTFITLAVSYVLSVVGAVSQKRSFASEVSGLGKRSEEVLRRGWNAKDFHALDLPLSTLSSQLGTLTEQHKSYPILHYYHSEQGKSASALSVMILDEALTLLRFCVPPAYQPNAALVESARSAIASYLETLQSAYIQPAERIPPPPDLEFLRVAGVPAVSDEAFVQELAGLEKRRRRLLGIVEADAWQWPPVKS